MLNSRGHDDYLKGYLPSLDGWRAIAIILVVVAHGSTSIHSFLAALGMQVDLSSLQGAGLIGVQVFFGLSGFIITSKLIEERQASGQVKIWAFYVRRIFRIIPAAALFLAVIVALTVIGQINVAWSRILSALFFFANYSAAPGSWYAGHFWSLAVEEHFYLVWPLIFLLLRDPRKQLILLFGGAACVALWRAVDFKFHITGSSSEIFWGRTDIQADNIIFGVIAAVAIAACGIKGSARIEKYWIFVLSLSALIVTYAMPSLDWKLSFALLTLRAAAIASVISISVLGGLRGRYQLLQWAPLRFIGSISYSLYLWQQIFLVEREGATGWLADVQWFPLNVFLACMCAILSKRYVERPMISWGKSLLRSPSAVLHRGPSSVTY